MSGHSFGAITTQVVAGQNSPGRKQTADPRIRAALPMSPSARPAQFADRLFGNVQIPWLLMTGTEDVSPIGDIKVADRLAVFPALPPGDKYELVLDGGEHSAFSERAVGRDQKGSQAQHHRSILAISTAFWEAYLKDDAAARRWLQSDSVKEVLASGDRWQKK
jgi:predicted dienelactone hydrolase